ncbi:unnamed protein product [Adineta steineri]|uniref:F-box domain-containing protein n=1 Tax=Adineta steineri TaxID=433720 RepID=A0A819INI1_9BILA|nr:unnamed protein product [Adineta steineri]CAF3919428.1 unnamed protein product [Adineta steineri]
MPRVLSEKKQIINHIENLSNEIFYEIFDYLDGCDIYQSFSNLNIRFQDFITHSTFYLKVQFSSKFQSNLTIKDRYERYILPNKHRIISFYCDNQLYYEEFIQLSPINSTFNHLEPIILKDISTIQFVNLFSYLKSLPLLSSLQIVFDSCEDDIGTIYQLIFQLPFLKYLKLDIHDFEISDLTLPMATNKQYSSIEFFVFLHYLTLDQFCHLLSYTPRLTHLYCYTILDFKLTNSIDIFTKLNNLVLFNLCTMDLSCNLCQALLSKLPLQLKILSVTVSDRDISYLDANRWEELIRKNMPNLERFTLCLQEKMDERFQITNYHKTIPNYFLPFWMEKEWIFRIVVEDDKIDYDIFPHSQAFYDFEEHLSYDRNSCPGVNLNIINLNKKQVYINRLKNLFKVINVTRLVIKCSIDSMKAFMKIFKLLPNLMMLRVTVLKHPYEFLDVENDMIQLRRYLEKSKITNVTLVNAKGSNDVDFIIGLSPQMKSFSIQIISNCDFLRVAYWILYRIKMNKMSHPMKVCIQVKEGTNDLIEKLYEMIDSKKLLENYTIFRKLDIFYIQWN